MNPVEISFPFRIDPSGQVATEINTDQQVANHIIALVGTQLAERIMLPNYGVNSMISLFEPDDEFIAQQLRTQISNALGQWEPGTQVVEVSISTSAEQVGAVYINVSYTRVNSGSNNPSDPSRLFTATIKTNGDIR